MQNILKNVKLKIKKKPTKLKKKAGVEKLVITLILVAVGVGLCIIFRNQLYTIMSDAFTTIGTQVKNLMSGTVTP